MMHTSDARRPTDKKATENRQVKARFLFTWVILL
jgi:hypothetical protein